MHIHEPISLTELAELVNLSPNHLSALFLKETSFRPTEYIRAQKLNYARYIFGQLFSDHRHAGQSVGVPQPERLRPAVQAAVRPDPYGVSATKKNEQRPGSSKDELI